MSESQDIEQPADDDRDDITSARALPQQDGDESEDEETQG